MKVKLDVCLKELNGKDIVSGEDSEKLVLEKVLWQALSSADPQDQNMESKYKKYKLAQKIIGKSEVDFSSEEITLLKQTVGKFWHSPIVCGQVQDLLENLESKAEEKK